MLASGSPQRTAILTRLGIRHAVHVTDVDELTEGPPEELVLENAHRKARAAAQRVGTDVPVLGVDTIVALGARILGKPSDAAAAGESLRTLAGREHAVLSGVCVIDDRGVRTAAARTTVRFRALDDDTVASYVATGEWRGRAGGYAIQERGALLVSRIDGEYLNVVGLPVATLLELIPDLVGDSFQSAGSA